MKSVAMSLIIYLTFPSLSVALDPSPPQTDWAILKSIAPGQPLQLDTTAGKSVVGPLERVTDSTLEVRVHGSVSVIQATEVARVYVLRERRAGKSTLIGMAIGGGSGAAVGAIAGARDNFFGPGAWVGTLTAAGVLVGGLIGIGVGSRQKKELVYEAPGVR